MKIVIKTNQLEALEKELRSGSKRIPRLINDELRTFGQEAIEDLKKKVWANAFELPEKNRDNGKPPLVDSEKYINSFSGVVKDGVLAIEPTGENDHMSNAELSEVLEYGLPAQGIPARPHIRPWNDGIERKIPLLMERIANGILGNR